MLLQSLLLAACVQDDAPPPGVMPDPIDRQQVIDAASLPNVWTLAGGWVAGEATVLGDLTGDGIADAAIVAADATSLLTTFIIAGPLRRPVTVPGDEHTMLTGGYRLMTGEGTGDGIPDLRIFTDSMFHLVPGPLPMGFVDPLVDGIPLMHDVVDIDGDGILDLAEGVGQEVRFTWGPASRWQGPADLVVHPGCDAEDAEDYGFRAVDTFKAHPDVDGDGIRDVWIEDDGQRVCSPWLFPLPSTGGDYDPGLDPSATYGVRDLQLVADQTGDGHPDVWTWQDRRLHAGPISFDADGLIAGTTFAEADDSLRELYPIAFDLDGDGLTDFVGLETEFEASWIAAEQTEDLGEVLVVVPGGAALAGPVYTAAWDIGGRAFSDDDLFEEDGVVGVLVTNGSEVVVIDLTEATP